MASLRKRLNAAWSALVGSPGLQEYASAMVRPHEVGNLQRRYGQTTAEQLCRRFTGHVKVCQSMNAAGVAAVKIGVYRRKGSGKKSAWDMRPVTRKELARHKLRGGLLARKAADLSDEVEEIIDPLHPLVAFLAKPNPMMDGFRMFEQTQFWLGLTGDSYWHKVLGPSGYPVEAWPIPPQFIRPVPSREVVISDYIYGRGTEVERTVPAAEIARIAQFNPTGDPYRGCGDLEACLDAADLSIAINQFRLQVMDNGAQPGGFIIAKTLVGEVPRQQLEEQVNRKYAGIAKAGRITVLTGEVEWQQADMGEKEVAFLASDDNVRELIANCHDIPIVLLTMRDTGALAAAKAAEEAWQTRGLRPRCLRIEDMLNQQVVPDFGDDRLYVCHSEVVNKDMAATSTRAIAEFGADLVTKNEARAELEYDAVPNGDKFKTELMPQTPPAIGGPGQNGMGKPKSADGENGAAKPAAKARIVPPLLLTNGPKAHSQSGLILNGECHCCTKHPAVVRKDAAMDRIDTNEKIMAAALAHWFLSIEPDLIAGLGFVSGTVAVPEQIATTVSNPNDAPPFQPIITTTATGAEATITPTFSLPASIGPSLERVIAPQIEALAKSGYNFGVIELGPSAGAAQIQANLTHPAAEFLRNYTGEVVKSVTATVDKQVREEIAQGIENGESIQQITERVTDTAQRLSTTGAERIARTESSRAFLAAREEAWKKSGTVWGKKWTCAPFVCDFCLEVAKRFNVGIPLGQPFFKKGDVVRLADGREMKLDYNETVAPPLHPSCRCSIVAVMEKP